MKQHVYSGLEFEQLYSYSRAVRAGDRILVAGTTATDEGGNLVGANDPAAQMEFVIDKIERAINELGGKLSDVVRTRIYVSDLAHWEPVARVHGRRFDGISPANSLVKAQLVGAGYLVEVEAEAVIDK
jgi:enamine deaminase RidA (YjgF/YER057c/UK114 family)